MSLSWLNVERPLTLMDLRGKVVILDFWTSSCINCLHIIPDLRKLERKYGQNLTIIGVHSPKFDVADPEASAVRRIDLRNGRVQALVGSRLFDFGGRDGPFATA